MLKKIGTLLIGLILTLISPLIIQAQTTTPPIGTTNISVFTRQGCSHCQDEKEFLQKYQQDNSDLTIKFYPLEDENNQKLFEHITELFDLTKSTPITLVRNQLILGFGNESTTGQAIRDIVADTAKPNLTFEEIRRDNTDLADSTNPDPGCNENEPCTTIPKYLVTVPFTNITIDVGAYPLTALSVVLGLIDGFNPCALWVLLMFLIILSQLGSRKKMIYYAGIFILAEAIMYYLILTIWLRAWNFIALDQIVTPLIGLLSLGSGVYFINKFRTYKEVCEVTSPEQRQKITEKVKHLAAQPFSIGVALGILGVAFSVNVIEFACSIGIPQTFTKILEMNNLGFFTWQGYMFLYILMYMLDDFLVFGIALISFEKIGVTHKYSKWSSLIGGILMLILGTIMLLNPSVLVF